MSTTPSPSPAATTTTATATTTLISPSAAGSFPLHHRAPTPHPLNQSLHTTTTTTTPTINPMAAQLLQQHQQQQQLTQITTTTPTHNSKQFGVDLLSGCIASFVVSPIVTAVDQAIAQSAAGSTTLLGSFTSSMRSIVTSPVQFINNGAFKWVFLIYAATYATANWTKTICANRGVINTSFPVWASTSVVNTAACINKDYQFAKLFSTGIPRPVPPTSLGIWAVRDCTSMFAFFTLPPIVADMVKEQTGNETLSKYSAQFFVPLVFQYLLTPIHRLGYDRYNNPNNNMSQVMEFLKKDFFLSSHLRMVRCFPPWVLGVTGNAELRAKLSALFNTTAHV